MPEIYTHRNRSPDPPANGGLLCGKRVVIQPNLAVRGWLCDAGSLALEGYVALEDATVVTRLKRAGAELVGSSRMSELGFGLAGDTATRVLTAGEAHIALVTDTLGEARVAAAGSGVFGFKPSFGRVSRSGLTGLVPSMESYGILGKRLEDVVDTFAVIAGQDTDDPSMPNDAFTSFPAAREPLKLPCTAGVVKECLGLLDDRERKAFQTGLARLEAAGLTTREVSLSDFNLFRVVHNVVGSVEASSSAGKYDGVRYGHRSSSGKNWNDMYLNSRAESFGPLIKTFLFQGAYFQFENYAAFENACRIRRRLVQAVADLFGHVDLLAFPTRRLEQDAARAATINQTYEAFSLTLPANVTGQPSLQVPSLALHAGADLGVQLTGLRLEDSRLFSIGLKLSSAAQGGSPG